MALTAKKLGITSKKIKAMTLEQLEDALTDVIDAREGYPGNSTSKNALELDELYLEIDNRINAINAGEETELRNKDEEEEIIRIIFDPDEDMDNVENVLDEAGAWYDYDSGDRMMINPSGLDALDEASIDYDEV